MRTTSACRFTSELRCASVDEKRSFGGVLVDAQTRLEYYHLVIDRGRAAVETPRGDLTWAKCGETAC